MDLPATGSEEESLQIVEGNLADQGHEALNIQVVIEATEDPQRLMLELMDAEGAFLGMILLIAAVGAPVESGGEGRAGADEPGDTGGEKEGKGPMVEEVLEQIRQLAQEVVSTMSAKIELISACMKDLWKANCSLSREFEEVVQIKDEIAELKRRLLHV